jgi:hypothetical protein
VRRVLITALLLVASVCVDASGATASRTHATRLGGAPLELVSTPTALWAITCDHRCSGEARRSSGRILRLDPRTGRVRASTRIDVPGTIAVSAGAVYAPDFWGGTLRRFDSNTLEQTATLRLALARSAPHGAPGFLPDDVIATAGSVWVSTEWCTLARTDRAASRMVARVPLPCDAYGAMAALGRDVWVSESLAGLYRVDATSNRVAARLRIGPPGRRLDVNRILTASGRVLAIGGWAAHTFLTGDNALAIVDPAGNRVVRTVPLPRGVLVAAASARWLFVARAGGSSIERIDPRTGSLAERIHATVGSALVASGDRLFTAFRDGTLVRIAR